MRHDYAGVVERQERLTDPVSYAWGVLSHLTGVKNSDPLREVYQELQVCLTACLSLRGYTEKLAGGGGLGWVVYYLTFVCRRAGCYLITSSSRNVVETQMGKVRTRGVGALLSCVGAPVQEHAQGFCLKRLGKLHEVFHVCKRPQHFRQTCCCE